MKLSKLAVVMGALPLVVTGCNDTEPDNTLLSNTDNTVISDSSDISNNGSSDNRWELVWSDEFDGEQIDTSKWGHEVNCWGGGNNEQQCYVDDGKNSFIADGLLTIRAIKGETTGSAVTQEMDGYGESEVTLPYSSARLRTMNKGDWKYGRFEIRAKLPQGQGTWPAIWMLPTDWVYGGWAASGEIDIMEAVNLHTTYDDEGVEKAENRVHGTLHYGKAWPNNAHSGVAYDFGDENINPADDFHTYAIEWEEGEIRWYVDDVHYATQTMAGWWSHYQDEEGNWLSGAGAAPFNQDFHLILNLAIGGAWPTAVNDTGIDVALEQAEMQVDYVRVYQCSADPATGDGCDSPVSDSAVQEPGVEEPAFPEAVDLSASSLNLFDNGELLEGFALNGWDDGANDTRQITEGVIDISISGNGNAYIEGAGDPLDMSGFVGGELAFELKVVSGAAGALSVKLDSGYPALAAIDIDSADLPVGDTWKTFRIPVSDFVDAGTNGFMISAVSNPIVFEPVNNADLHFQVKNISFAKPLVVLSEQLQDGFTLDGYTDDAEDTLVVVDGIAELDFAGAGNAFFTAASAVDMSPYTNWVMKFDLKVVEKGSVSDVLVKMDSGWPNVSDIALGETSEGMPADSEWHSYTIPVADFIAAENRFSPGSKMDISSVTNPVVFEGSGGSDLHIQIADIRFEVE